MNEPTEPGGKPFAEFVRAFLGERFYKIGINDFDQFVPLALNSHVPIEYLEAMNGQIRKVWPEVSAGLARFEVTNAYPKIAQTLFSKVFDTPDEAQYAVAYAHAVSMVKTWNKISLDNKDQFEQIAKALKCNPSEVMKKLEAMRGSIPKATALLPELAKLQETETKMRREATSIYGMSKNILQEGEQKDKRPLNLARHLLTGSSGMHHRFISVRNYVESYFAVPANSTRMKFLAHSTRK